MRLGRIVGVMLATLVSVMAMEVAQDPNELVMPAAQSPPRELVEEMWEASGESSGSSSSASPTPTPSTSSPRRTPFVLTSSPAASSVFVGTVAPEIESTFFGLFPTKTLYLSVGMGGPVLFFLYKLALAGWFCTAGCKKFAREDKERELRVIEEREEMIREQEALAVAAQIAAKEAVMARPNRKGGVRASATNANATNANFWVEEELQAWRLDFQQLKMTKCLTSTPNQRRHVKSPRGDAPPSVAASEVWLATYFARDADNQLRDVVLKWIPTNTNANTNLEAQQDKLKEEIRRQAKLRHPNVAAFIGIAWSPETNLVAVTEYMPRGDLRQWLHRTATKEVGRWSPLKLKMLLDVTNALVYLHAFQPKLVHGNCNSRNVLISEKMEAKLSDFGAPKDHLTEREISAYKEVGSGRWISPEALIGRDQGDVSDAMDVYALGIMMVEMDTHELPFADLMQADRSQLPENDVLQLIASGALTPTLSPTCHPRIQQLVNACTQYNPHKRPSSRDIARVLQAALLEAQNDGGRRQ